MTGLLALDTSAAIPLLVRTHQAHQSVTRRCSGRALTLAGPALAETYSVLTRLPGDVRLAPADAAHLMATRLEAPLVLSSTTARDLPEVLSRHGVAGGAVYDALVALSALEHDVELATRDARARDTYSRIGVRVLTLV